MENVEGHMSELIIQAIHSQVIMLYSGWCRGRLDLIAVSCLIMHLKLLFFKWFPTFNYGDVSH